MSDLMIHHKKILKGCKNGREFVKKNKIPDKKYIYAKKDGHDYTITDGTSRKFDKIYIIKKWFDDEYINNEESIEEEQIDDAPSIIKLKDMEKFVNNDGEIVEIEVRGERDHKKCYFKVKDIMSDFGIKYLNDTITNKNRNGYVIDIHYKYFYDQIPVKDRHRKIKNLYLTYLGILRFFFTSHKGTADKFVNWATETLFTAHMGTTDSKKGLASAVLGVSVSDIKSVFSKTKNALPTIYLFTLGTVKDLRKIFYIGKEYDDNDIVGKIGMTKDLKRRAGEHERDYGKIKNVQVELAHFNYIDPQYISSAETDLKDILNELGLMLEHEKYDELIVFNKKQMKIIKKQYEQIGKSYIGHVSELVTKIKYMESETKIMKKDIEIMEEKHNNEIMKKDMEIMKKDMEIMKLSKRNK